MTPRPGWRTSRPARSPTSPGRRTAADAAVLRDYEPVKRVALIACLVHKARMRARDDLATMFCKRVAMKVKTAKTELEEIRQRQRAMVEALVGNFRTLLGQIDPAAPRRPGPPPRMAGGAHRSRCPDEARW